MEAVKKLTKEKIYEDKEVISPRKSSVLTNLKNSIKAIKWYEWIMMAIMIGIAAYAMITAFVNPTKNSLPAWLTVVNFISAICGVVCVFLCAKASIANFAFATVNTIVYMIYLAYSRIYGTFLLELIVYFPINFISWYIWAKHRDEEREEITKSKKLTIKQDIVVSIVVISAAIIYHSILVRVGGNVPWLDSFTLSIGIIAVVLEMLRYREQYVLWIVTDVIAVAMYIVHFDVVYLTKKSIYLIMAVIGLYNWWKLQKTRNIINN
jgi:nicotinamide mononucleotide transporter